MRTLAFAVGALAPGCHASSGPPPAADAATLTDASVGPPGPCTTDDDCGAHEVCDVGATPPACVCAAGYAAGPSGACAWAGVIADPGCAASGSWNLHGHTQIDSTYLQIGMVDVGACEFYPDLDVDPDCTSGIASFDQTLVMPRYARAEPLVLRASYLDDSNLGWGPWFNIATAWHDVLNPGPTLGRVWRSARSCLGAAEYAPPSSTGVGAPRQLRMTLTAVDLCLHESDIFVDRIDVVPAEPGECPAPGTALNGDAEAAGGWTFSPSGTSTAGLVAGAGANGSRGVALHLDHRCEDVIADDPISIPVDAPSAAISFYARVPVGATLTLIFGGLDGDLTEPLPRPTVAVVGDGAATTRLACIPAYLRGTATTLRARLAMSSPSGPCDVVGLDAAIDDVAIVDAPGCGGDAGIADPSFESASLLVGAQGSAAVVHDPAVAHTGGAALALGLDSACRGGSWSVDVMAPPWGTGAGPAYTYWYMAPIGTPANVLWSGAVADGAWHPRVGCLPPSARDVPRVFGIGLAAPVPTPPTCTPAHLYIDDVALTTDPACPAM